MTALHQGPVPYQCHLELVPGAVADSSDELYEIDGISYAVEEGLPFGDIDAAKIHLGNLVLLQAVDATGNSLKGQRADPVYDQQRWRSMSPEAVRLDINMRRQTQAGRYTFQPFNGILDMVTPRMAKIRLHKSASFIVATYNNNNQTPTHAIRPLTPISD